MGTSSKYQLLQNSHNEHGTNDKTIFVDIEVQHTRCTGISQIIGTPGVVNQHMLYTRGTKGLVNQFQLCRKSLKKILYCESGLYRMRTSVENYR